MGNVRQLASGRLCEVDENGKATLLTCTWLIEVASGNPEPDSYADTIKIIECGGKLFGQDNGGWRCEYGHHHHPMGSAEWAAEDFAEWQAERSEAGF